MKKFFFTTLIAFTNSYACVDDNGVFYDFLLDQSPGKTCMEVIADAHKYEPVSVEESELAEIKSLEEQKSKLFKNKAQLENSQIALKERAWKGDLVIGQYCNVNGKKECIKLPVYIGMQFEIDLVQSQMLVLNQRIGKIQRKRAKERDAEYDARMAYRKQLTDLEKTYLHKGSVK